VLSERDLTAEEQAKYDAHKASAASLKNRISMAMESETAAAGLAPAEPAAAAAPAARGEGAVVIAAGARIQSAENADADPRRGFRSLGDFAAAVIGASSAARTGNRFDGRLNSLWSAPQAAAPGTYAGEGNGSDGGFLIPPGFSTSIFQLSLEEDSFLPLCDVVTIDSNSMSFPRDETTPWGTNGIRAYWQGEATSGRESKPVLGLDSLRLKKLIALTPVTDEMMADSSAMASYLPGKMSESIRWKANEAIVFGTGGAQPLGMLNSSAAVTQAKDVSQATGTLSATHVSKMMARLIPGSCLRALWLVNNDVLPSITTMTLGNQPIYMAPGSPNSPIGQAPYGMLLGRPLSVTQHAKAFSSEADVSLVDFKGYRVITKAGGIETATSMHLYFDADSMAFRTTFRMDGAPMASQPVTPANGSNTLSHFIKLQAR
jgi:HK97 family phage major capsid protein